MKPRKIGQPARLLIGVVGVCGSGKSTLIDKLVTLGYFTRHIAQEHSYVKDMWRRITNPDLLIFLDVSYTISCQRKNMKWTEKDYIEQQRRLEHARAHMDFYLDTTSLNPDEVLSNVLSFLNEKTYTD